MDDLSAYLQGFIAILLLTSFVKVFTVLSILRYGLGLDTAGMGLVVFALSFALALALASVNTEHLTSSQNFLAFGKTLNQQNIEPIFKPFLERNVDKAILQRISASIKKGKSQSQPTETAGADSNFNVLVASFLITELKMAFQLGFLILIPFLVIDLVVTNILAALAVTQISQAVVSLPLKILLFFAIDGWTLISDKLLSSYS